MRPAAAFIGLLAAVVVPFVPGAATAASAPAPSSFEIVVDPRFELLGVLYQLSGRGSRASATAGYRKRVLRRFRPFRRHPAVAAFKEVLSDSELEEAAATFPIHFSNPPELTRLDAEQHLPYLDDPGRRARMMKFWDELRAFAVASDFMSFYGEERGYYRTVEESARKRLAGLDPVAAFEELTGMSASSRVHYVELLLYENKNNYIVPYPLPPTAAGAAGFEVYTVSSYLNTPRYREVLWDELPYVIVDPAFYYFDKSRVPDRGEFYGESVARCRRRAPDCAKHQVVAAIKEELRKTYLPGSRPFDDSRGTMVRRLTEKLDEYRGRRERYPTLWSFFPRLLGAYYEAAHPGEEVPADLVRRPRRVRAATEFFEAERAPAEKSL